MIDFYMQKSTYIFMFMIYELLRKLLGKLRKVMKTNEESYGKTEDNLGEYEEIQRKNEDSYEKLRNVRKVMRKMR